MPSCSSPVRVDAKRVTAVTEPSCAENMNEDAVALPMQIQTRHYYPKNRVGDIRELICLVKNKSEIIFSYLALIHKRKTYAMRVTTAAPFVIIS